MKPSFVQRLPINNIHVLFTLGGTCWDKLLAVGGREIHCGLKHLQKKDEGRLTRDEKLEQKSWLHS